MASKRRLRRKQCDGKRRFPDQGAAQWAATQYMRARGFGSMMTAYHCRFCNGYHIGHAPAHVRYARTIGDRRV